MGNPLIITITPSLRIKVGNGSATIEEETVVKTGDNAGRSKWSPTDGAYHGTLDDALASLFTHHLDKLTDQQIFDIGRARDEIASGVQLLRQVSAGRLLSEKRAAEAQVLELAENVERLEADLKAALADKEAAELGVESEQDEEEVSDVVD